METKLKLARRIYFLKIPVDIIDEQTCLQKVESLLENKGQHQITFLSLQRLFKARRDIIYYNCLHESTLILPTSRGIIRGARFLKLGNLSRYNPFDFIITLLSFAEKNGKSVYLLGSKKYNLERAEQNLRTSFPELKIIGRFTGYFNQEVEKNVILAIKKSAPCFLFVGKGIKDKELWLLRNKKRINPGIYIWVDNCFEIFAGTEKYVAPRLFNSGLEILSGIMKRPWRILKFFSYLYFNFLLLINRVFKL